MRARPRLLRAPLVVLTMLAGFLLGSGIAQALTPVELNAVTDDYLFNRSLGDFGAVRSQLPYAEQLDWSSDGCTLSPDDPFGFKFLPTCHRHDFGYRNYRLQDRFTEYSRLALDDRFRSDMYTVCGSNWWCRRIADVYHWAARQFGGTSFSTAEAIEAAKRAGFKFNRPAAPAYASG
jgi:hypothetical protein